MEIWGGNQPTDKALSTPGLDVWVHSRPYQQAEHGGDVYYTSLCGGGMITRLILADVSGHGTAVADVAKSLRTLMRKNINRKSQAKLVAALNREFGELAKQSRFATALVATYLTKGDTLSICNAGHPRPLWRRAKSGEWAFLSGTDAAPDAGVSNLPLGIMDESGYTQFDVALEPDDLILFYTDAVTEAEGPGDDRLGEAGLLTLAKKLDAAEPAQIVPALLEELDRYRGNKPADDDLTVLLLHHNASPTRHPSLKETLSVYAKVFGLKSV